MGIQVYLVEAAGRERSHPFFRRWDLASLKPVFLKLLRPETGRSGLASVNAAGGPFLHLLLTLVNNFLCRVPHK